MKLDPDGAQYYPAAFTTDQINSLERILADAPALRAGMRLRPTPGLAGVVGPATAIAVSILGRGARPVRATLFDKTAARNWSVGWHQDRTIAVLQRIETPGFADWTTKAGIAHVVPPFEILERMLTIRIHIDPAGMENGPLLIVPGSHRLGRIAEPDVAEVAARGDTRPCPARRGDVWVYATPILHASARVARPGRRRVLQLLYSTDDLPNDLAWLGV